MDKIKEAALSVLPIVLIVLLLSLCLLPMKPELLLCFLIGALMLVIGMGLFSLGAEQSMTKIGSGIGTVLTRIKSLPVILLISFLLGFAVTVAEPDLQVLALTVPHIKNSILLVTVGVGVGFFMAVCMLRIITGMRLKTILLGFYILVFALAVFSDGDYLSVAFDSGGVTTGPMTVPFILAVGLGVSRVRSDSRAEADSFGLVALCSIGPVLSVLILGFLYRKQGAVLALSSYDYLSTTDIGLAFISAIPIYMKEMALALLPVFVIFIVFQFTALKLSRRNISKILIGMVYTYAGLVIFLTGVNVGFASLGAELGTALVKNNMRSLLIPLSMLIGWFIISAEPAVAVLEKQIEEVSAGAISGKTIKLSLSIAISLAMGLAMLRVLTGISILYFLIPGYAIALLMSFFAPDIYTAIAFDSGGVASGPMTATFMLQFMIGTSHAMCGDVMRDAFGLVAMVAMLPLLSVQTLGFIAERTRRREISSEFYGDYDIIELWEDIA